MISQMGRIDHHHHLQTTTTTATTATDIASDHDATTTATPTSNHPNSTTTTRHQQLHLHQDRQQQEITEIQLSRLNKLIEIIRRGSYDDLTELLAERKFKDVLNVFVDGHTALHYSLIYGRGLEWCKELVSNGANPNLTDKSGWHPIHLAAFNGSRETMRYLIDCLAN